MKTNNSDEKRGGVIWLGKIVQYVKALVEHLDMELVQSAMVEELSVICGWMIAIALVAMALVKNTKLIGYVRIVKDAAVGEHHVLTVMVLEKSPENHNGALNARVKDIK